MPVSCADFIDQAEVLLESNPEDEMHLRSSVSRAYYSAYHSSLDFANSVSVPPVSDCGGRTHEKLRLYYGESFHPVRDVRLKYRKVGYKLKQLHDNRVVSDYLIGLDVTETTARSHLERCKQLLADIMDLQSIEVA